MHAISPETANSILCRISDEGIWAAVQQLVHASYRGR